jgi:hypothetical protein
MWARRIGVVGATVVALVAAVLATPLLRSEREDFSQRRVRVAELPSAVRGEVVAHGGGRCVEQHAGVYFCVLVRPKQAHEGRSGPEWCFDDDGPRTVAAYPASRADGAWKCASG